MFSSVILSINAIQRRHEIMKMIKWKNLAAI